jgi:hypothetical protein
MPEPVGIVDVVPEQWLVLVGRLDLAEEQLLVPGEALIRAVSDDLR